MRPRKLVLFLAVIYLAFIAHYTIVATTLYQTPYAAGRVSIYACPGDYMLEYKGSLINASSGVLLEIYNSTQITVLPDLALPPLPPGQYLLEVSDSIVWIVEDHGQGCPFPPPSMEMRDGQVYLSLTCIRDILYVKIGHIETGSREALPLEAFMYNSSEDTLAIPGKEVGPLLLDDGKPVSAIVSTCNGIFAFSLTYNETSAPTLSGTNSTSTYPSTGQEEPHNTVAPPFPEGVSTLGGDGQEEEGHGGRLDWIFFFAALASVIVYLVWVVKRGSSRKGG